MRDVCRASDSGRAVIEEHWSWGYTAGFVTAQMEVLKSKRKDLLKTLQNCGPGANRDHPEVRCYASNPHNFRSPAMTGSKCVVDPSLKRT